MIKFGQGSYGTSENGKTLISSGHLSCYSIILLNLETGKAQMHHVWEGGNEGLSDDQREGMDAFTDDLGRIVAVVMEGSESRNPNRAQEILAKRGVEIVARRRLKTDGDKKSWWTSEFIPTERRIRISMTEQGTVLFDNATLFPPLESVPVDEVGLDRTARIRHRLDKWMDAGTGELSAALIPSLQLFLDRPTKSNLNLRAVLFQQELDRRAKAANPAFQDFHDYLDHDRTNFYKIVPGSPECVIRRLQGVPGNLPDTFRNTVEASKITTDILMDLFRDHPAQLLQLVKFLETKSSTQALIPQSRLVI